jgi:hypothetical protein
MWSSEGVMDLKTAVDVRVVASNYESTFMKSITATSSICLGLDGCVGAGLKSDEGLAFSPS